MLLVTGWSGNVYDCECVLNENASCMRMCIVWEYVLYENVLRMCIV